MTVGGLPGDSLAPEASEVRAGVDVGGTFTDAALVSGSQVVVAKVRSTPEDPALGFGAAIDVLTARAGIEPPALTYLAHGTTVATNAIVQSRFARAALLTTAGFADILEIGTQMRRHVYDMWTPEPRPVIPRERCFGVRGRLAADGTELEPLDEQDVGDALRAAALQGVDALAVCFLHSYANPAHERRARALAAEVLPGVPVCVSSEVAPEFREYVRASTTAFNAALLPVAGAYVERLVDAARARRITTPVHLMQSNGGVARADVAARLPVALVASGPSACVVAAARVAVAAGCPDLLTFDMGGTTTDVALVVDGTPVLRPHGDHEGRPLNVPQVDVISIGAGGGSIARVDSAGRLHVGPESAGADPGPAAYASGGDEATVTDAHAVIGTIRAGELAGGVTLDAAAAADAIDQRVARPLALSVREAAAAIIRVADANMAGALRLVSVSRGHDPRAFTLVCAGGAGGMHACAVAEILGVTTVLVPRYPGIAAALGLLHSDERHEVRRSLLRPLAEVDAGEVDAVAGELADEARRLLGSAPGGEVRMSADLRFRGQAYNLTVPVRGHGAEFLSGGAARFLEAHEQSYGFLLDDTEIELVTLRAAGIRATTGGVEGAGAEPAGAATARPPERRRLYLNGATREVQVFDRASIADGDTFEGPLVIEQEDSTTVVADGWSGSGVPGGVLRLERA